MVLHQELQKGVEGWMSDVDISKWDREHINNRDKGEKLVLGKSRRPAEVANVWRNQSDQRLEQSSLTSTE